MITSKTLEKEISNAIPYLLKIARELSANQISDNFKFILSEIKNSPEDFYIQRKQKLLENEKKKPAELRQLIPKLQKIYDDLYDINLYVYKAERNYTIIDIRYYLKSSLDEAYRKTVDNHPPMLHCKVTNPPNLINEDDKFDINWEHNEK